LFARQQADGDEVSFRGDAREGLDADATDPALAQRSRSAFDRFPP
jgi:hypothetical protein